MPHRQTPAASREISEATIVRLPSYLRSLEELAEQGVKTVSSNELAEACAVQPALLRRDLSHFGSYGTRGVGYDVDLLIHEIGVHVGSEHTWRVIIVGSGNLGQALARHSGLASRGFKLVGLIDSNPDIVGRTVANVEISDDSHLEDVVKRKRANIAVVTTPPGVAQHIVDRLVASGIRSIMNFA
ncbi:MAG TPA: redox-sensing transcriptional repressor Rex, partial [Propionibacteriaceae bacterium]|nr:redox-sensing transcriptional repressor Rex [Propionibacteriaceae bacterium]